MHEEELRPGESTTPVVAPAPPELRDRGKFIALLVYRPFDGGELRRIAGLADTEEHACAEVLQTMRDGLGRVQTMAPDSTEVRTFISAVSHMHDLRQALSALDAATATDDSDTAQQLRVYAVVAFGRTSGSRSRPDLSEFIDFSATDSELMARLKVIRNRYAAHSENDMTITTPVLDLQKQLDGEITVEQVWGITVDSPMPQLFIDEFAALLPRLIEQLTAALQPLKEQVRASVSAEQRAELFADPQPLQFVTAPVADWEPNTRRPPYPASRLSTVHLDANEQVFNANITS